MGIIADVVDAAMRMGSCEPQWLKNQTTPDFKTVEMGESGPELILLHGLLGAVSNWDTVLPMFAKYSKACALHFPILTGHRSEVRIKSLAAFTECFVRTRNIQPVALCGNSLGGHVALRVALATPQIVDCLVLSGASGLYEHSVDALPVRPDHEYLREQMARVFKNPKFITDESIQSVHDILADKGRVLNLIHSARSAKRDNVLDELKQIKIPTLLLWGEDDEITTMQVAEVFHKNIANSKLVVCKNCGHAPMIEHPQWFADEVEKFLHEHSRHYKTK